VGAPAAEVTRAASGWAKVEAVDEGSSRLEMNVDDLHWPVLLLAALEADFEIVEPPELADYLRATGERFIRGSGRPAEAQLRRAMGSTSSRSS
jgi:predicted DNA-binding transcriptional regulator YafY